MGIFPSPQECFFTGLPTINILTEQDSIDYYIIFNNKKVNFSLCSTYDWSTSKIIKDNTSIIKGDIYNLKWPTQGQYITEDVIQKQILTTTAPRTPKEKLDNLFLEVFKIQKFDGENLLVNNHFDDYVCSKLYFKSIKECYFYLETLHEQGLIAAQTGPTGTPYRLSITFKGLNYQVELTESGLTSNNCFIAMSFSENMIEIRNAIKNAIIQTGFNPILIDEVHMDSDKTINDEMIANIKKSKFCISDFTEQKDGVYFEAGYALGRGLKVIYTCDEKCFNKTHFDTNHFPHIIYKEPSELSQKLVSKIEAWIK